jgi:Golgi apparatus protein 1
MLAVCTLLVTLVSAQTTTTPASRLRTKAADIRAAATPVYVVERSLECADDLERFCKGKTTARARWQCLLPKVTEVFSVECERLIIEAQKFNLAHGEAAELPDACQGALAAKCSGREAAAAEQCLVAFERALPSACAGANAYQLQAALDDIRMDAPLESACQADIGKYCAHVRAGQGRLLVCLRRHMDTLSSECREQEFQELIFASSNINFNPMLIKNCDHEMQSLCADIEPGEGRVIRCLEKQRGAVSMRGACRKAVTQQLAMESTDARLNFKVAKQCEWEVKNFCLHVPPGHGRLHNCLFNHKNKLTRSCRRAEFQAINTKMMDIEVDEDLHSSCQGDIAVFCTSVSSGAVKRCLRLHLEVLSSECQKAEFAELTQQLDDARVNPEIVASCAAEAKQFCNHIQVGGGRIIACLHQHRFMKDMGAACRSAITSAYDTKAKMMHTIAMHSAPACRKDATRLCSDLDASPSMRDLHICLAKHRNELSPLCRKIERGGDGKDALGAAGHDHAENHAVIEKSQDWRLSLSKFLENMSTADERLVLARTAQHDVEKILRPCSRDLTDACKGVEPGGGRMLHCLSKHRRSGDLTIPCHATLKNVDLASVASITGHGPRDVARVLFKCARESTHLCSPNNGTILACLQGKMSSPTELSGPCRAGLHRDRVVVADHGESPPADMVSMCVNDIHAFCAHVPEGRLQRMHVVRCLNAARASGKPFSKRCEFAMSDRLMRLRKTRQSKGDSKISAMCKADLKSYCGDALPVRALLRDCLVNNKGRISTACFGAEFDHAVSKKGGDVAWVLISIMVLGVGSVASICISRLLSRSGRSVKRVFD